MKRIIRLYQSSIFLLFVKSFCCYLKQLSNSNNNKKDITSIRAIGVAIFLLVNLVSFAQSSLNKFLTPSDSLNVKKRNTVYISESVVLGGALIGLNQLWYADYPKSNFHTVSDGKQWLQLDKAGHFYSTYHVGKLGKELLQWSGADTKEQLVYGASLGFVFLTTVEVFDGFSKEWGFSWGDMVANASGTGFYVAQELLWKEQRILPKFSFHATQYANTRPEVLGSSLNEQILKDYNGQTYWLSFNMHAFTKSKVFPKWFNLAIGYGGRGMYYGSDQEALKNNRIQKSQREFYLSFDIDLEKIHTNSHFLKTFFSVFNTIKIPAPTLQTADFNDVKLHFVYF